MHNINLLPNQSSSALSIRHLVSVSQLIIIGIATIMGLSGFLLQYSSNGTASQIEKLKITKEGLKTEIEQATQLQQKLANINDRQQIWQNLELDDPHYELVLRDLAAAVPEKLRITQISTVKNQFAVTGLAADRNIITDFISNLNTQPSFTNIILSQANAQGDAVSFSLVLELRLKDESVLSDEAAAKTTKENR